LFLLIGEDAAPGALAALQNLAAMKGRSDYVTVLSHGPNTVGVKRAGLTPSEGGMNGAQVLEAAANGQIDLLFLAAANPFNGARDFETAQRALEATPFVVVQTLFLNEVTEYADVVLPAASYLESDGTTTNFAGRVQNIKAAFRPRERRDEDGNTISACAPDWVIFTKLAQLMGQDTGIKAVKGWMDKFKALPNMISATPRLQPVAFEMAPVVVPEGEFRLLTGPLLYDGGESFAYCERLSHLVPDAFVAMNRADARRLKIENGAKVELKTSRGTAVVRAKVGRSVKEGTLWMPTRLRQVRANQLVAVEVPFTSATVTKLEDAPKELLVMASEHATGVAQGAAVTALD
jgi:predicted molibdopterin-dependent oxidoreductase YjgC